ncbi:MULTISPECIES: aldo/keto reductase [unclassified Curtobacterium]|uniref:aldo/keto reductase n=1 Tax=unclassified Curtobacterium TaxID=257496 RepID=UPI000DAA141C|nr:MULTISPECIES: aldo/keto reductase [unclassified Curtobacterium]PZE27958.1 aldo/keto reductase [Curtobacterium sp. MCBD17_028]PZE78280.1 aldo/keto reductase [Curtobacterium sp. MCBD17_019]PZF62441.1 aldo/keto reductase [Curtobacterium sp. MCBD17_034]PZF63695.1 aldo/keto reductase [Curtobacterium sp. MCBD17_013]PZM39853.1 aldo/keto reductase [Curtobacterium sp. MCBD17_031]
MTSTVPDITLNDGRTIPQLGFGVFQIPAEQTKEAVLTALEVGYRHIDTAEMYGNEKEVGEAVAASGIPREEIFITSKLNNGFHAPDAALENGKKSAELLGGYMDLFLIHWPLATVIDFVPTWKALEELYHAGTSRSIGVSNFQAHHLHRLRDETTVTPAVNQIEVHPYLVQDPLRAADSELGIATEAWSPIAQGLVLDDPTITRIASALDKTPAQVVLRWHIQRGDIVFPKSVTRSRVEENFALFDFELSGEDMTDITSLDKGQRTGPDPDTFDYVPA